MAFDLKGMEEGVWFPFQDSRVDDSGEVEWLEFDTTEEVCFKKIDPDQLQEIEEKNRGKKKVTPVLNKLTRQMELVTTFEQSAKDKINDSKDFWNCAIVDWKISDLEGKAIECNKENKYKLVKGSGKFLRFANRCMEQLGELEVKAGKN